MSAGGKKPPLRHVAIIGGGTSGLGAAWARHHHSDRFDFRLFEAQGRIGGNAVTADMPQDDGTFIPFDISVTACIPALYHHIVLLMKQFGIELVDDFLSLHASDPQFLPESNFRFVFSAALIASVYLGDMFSFAVYAMASQPELYNKIQSEADAMFADGDPTVEDFTPAKIDITHRFLMECLRMYPIVPMSLRNVMNSCVVENYELPVGERLHIAQTAAHYMEDVFRDPWKFDIDRYLPPRNEHHSPGYAPYRLGTHTCLGSRWMDLHLAANTLMPAHHFTVKVAPENYRLRYNPLPSMKPSKKLKFLIAQQRREINV